MADKLGNKIERIIGSPLNGDQGAGTVNAESLFDNGNRVFSPSNPLSGTHSINITGDADSVDGFNISWDSQNNILNIDE